MIVYCTDVVRLCKWWNVLSVECWIVRINVAYCSSAFVTHTVNLLFSDVLSAASSSLRRSNSGYNRQITDFNMITDKKWSNLGLVYLSMSSRLVRLLSKSERLEFGVNLRWIRDFHIFLLYSPNIFHSNDPIHFWMKIWIELFERKKKTGNIDLLARARNFNWFF